MALTRARAAVVTAAAAAVVAGSLAAPLPFAQAAPPACTPDPVLCPEKLYVGASVPGLPTNRAAAAAFADAVGHDPSVAMYFAAFGDQVDTAALQRLVDDGRLPMITWEPFDAANPTANPYPLRQIADGRFDDYLRQQAAKIAAVDGPVAVRFAHEMNGGWYPWGRGLNGNTDADYVAAYRHVHDVLTDGGAGDTVFVWSPNLVDFDPTQDLGPLYPGDGYVDWVGLSAYMDETTDTYTRMFPSTLAQLDRVAPTKPVYVAETAVLPGETRPAMIRDLVAGLLATPRLVGFTWFDHVTRFDWRIETDPAAAAALAEALDSPYFGAAGQMRDPVFAAPVAMGPPWITGTAQAGQTLASSTGSWRSASGSGELTVSRRWHRCTSATDIATCTATSATNGGYGLTQWDANKVMRIAVTATNSAGSTTAWSAATQTVLMTPATPDAPAVQAYSGALKVTFPAKVPFGATHWRLSVNGVDKPLIPVTTKDYWLTGLTNGTSYNLGFAAVDASQTGSLSSPVVAGTGVPMTAPWGPYLRLEDTTLTAKLPPQAPAGATGWRLTVGGVTRDLPLTATYETFTGLTPGADTPWTLHALAGSWGGQTGISQPAKGAVTPVGTGQVPATPAAPQVEARDGALRVVFPAPPANATHWKLSINGAAKPLIEVGRADYWLTGLTNGTGYTLGLAGAVVTPTASASGSATNGTAVPMTAPWNPTVTVNGTTATVKLPPQTPAGATGWRLTVGGVTRDLPTGTTTSEFGGLTPGQTTRWELRAVAGSWAGAPGSVTPAASGSFTPVGAVPAQPATPFVEARSGALRVVFPAVPANATHWQLSIDGAAKPLIGVDKADYWLTGLSNGTGYTLSLAAANVTASATATGAATTGTAVPMTAPWSPYITVKNGVATVKLPSSVPGGATGWRLTVGDVTRDLPIGTVSSDFAVPAGQSTAWELRAVAGAWAGGPGSVSTAATGTITG